MPPRRPYTSAVRPALAGLLVVAAGCGDRGARADRPRRLSVFAASSLTEAFEELARGFERLHPGADVHLTFAGSQILRLQLEEGAPADVFASADERQMRALVSQGLIAGSRVFAGNELALITPKATLKATTKAEGSRRVARFEDLDRAARVVIGTASVPVGRYARRLLRRAGRRLGPAFEAAVRAHVVSRESNVRLVRTKVELGEVDAALVYRTDALGSERVRAIPIPATLNVCARYPIGLLARSPRRGLAADFVAYVLSPTGRAVLRRHGFSEPAS